MNRSPAPVASATSAGRAATATVRPSGSAAIEPNAPRVTTTVVPRDARWAAAEPASARPVSRLASRSLRIRAWMSSSDGSGPPFEHVDLGIADDGVDARERRHPWQQGRRRQVDDDGPRGDAREGLDVDRRRGHHRDERTVTTRRQGDRDGRDVGGAPDPRDAGIGHQLGEESARRVVAARRTDDRGESESTEGVRHIGDPARNDDKAGGVLLRPGDGDRGQAAEDQVEVWIGDAGDVDRQLRGLRCRRIGRGQAIQCVHFHGAERGPTMNQGQGTDEIDGADRRAGRRDVHGEDLPSVQVLRRIEADILTGRLKPGSRLAPERELGARLGVARNTLRRALTELGAKGLIQARGRGGWVIVGPSVTERIEGPPSLTEWAARHGYVVTSQVVTARVRTVASAEAADLRITMSSKIFELERIRYIEGVPLSFDRSVLHPRLIPVLKGVDFASRSLFGTIRERAGVIASRAEVVVHAVPATERAASLLTIAKGEPLLQLYEMTYDQYDEPFETANLLNRGDRYAFATTLTAGVGSPRVAL